MTEIKNVCVYCGSSSNVDEGFKVAATKIGNLIAEQGWGVVYGGGRVGLMGLVADGALDKGGSVIGIIITSVLFLFRFKLATITLEMPFLLTIETDTSVDVHHRNLGIFPILVCVVLVVFVIPYSFLDIPLPSVLEEQLESLHSRRLQLITHMYSLHKHLVVLLG